MLGPYLRSLRVARNIKASDAIVALEAPKATFYMWESVRSRPDPVCLGRMLDLYQASPIERAEAWRLRALVSDDDAPAVAS